MSNNHEPRPAGWRTSTRSGGTECVEVHLGDANRVAVRDSADRTGPILRFSAASWRAFVAGLRAGRI